MAIDRVGKSGAVPAGAEPSTPAEAAKSAEPASRFGVDATTVRSAPLAAPPAVPTASVFEQMRAGVLSVDAYLDQKVSEATSHLTALAPADLASIRAALRERLAADPTLVDLVRTATTAAPAPRAHDD
jgi:hypothetical protein